MRSKIITHMLKSRQNQSCFTKRNQCIFRKHISFCYGKKVVFELIFINVGNTLGIDLLKKNRKQVYVPISYLILNVVFKNSVMSI